MPKPKKAHRLGGSAAHQKLILRNLATSLFQHGKITTTETKARLLRPYAEKLITKAKKGGLANRRAIAGVIYTEPQFNESGRRQLAERNRDTQVKLFTEIAEMFKDRPGGYTRITKLGPRKGDNAPMAVIELVTEPYTPSAAQPKAKPAPQAAPVEEPVAEESTTEDTDATTAGDAPTEMAEEASPEESVVAEEQAETEAPAEDSTEDSTENKDA